MSDFSAKKCISWREQVTFDEMMIMIPTLYQHAEFYFYNASSLKQHSVGRNLAPFKHIILISSQPIFSLLLKAVCLA
jgi:hypothetical protein